MRLRNYSLRRIIVLYVKSVYETATYEISAYEILISST